MEVNNTIPYTVKDLIASLNKFPQDLPVLVSGYESGFECFYEPEILDLVYKQDTMYYDGEYQLPSEGEISDVSAVVLQRIMRDD